MIDHDKFFTEVRRNPFGGSMTQPQVDGCNVILDEWQDRKLTDFRWLAYILATPFWETARTMQPIREYGLGAAHDYGRRDPETGQYYYGRGYVQLTWKSNYEKIGKLLGIDLVNEPDKALEPAIAAAILFEGMIGGLFTGVGLGRYFNEGQTDWYNARRIVNGLDRANEISDIAVAFYAALTPQEEVTA